MPFRRLQYMISLISNRAILFDIKDIKECHKNLTDGRLPTINSLEYAEKKEASKSLRPFWSERKRRTAEKKSGEGASV